MKVRVEITRRPGIADPEASTTQRALQDLGFEQVGAVRFGRSILLAVDDVDDPAQAEKLVAEMCERLLANPVIEDYTVTALPDDVP